MICPNCKNEQIIGEKQYGALYTCGSCQAVYFINFDGHPEFGEIETSEEISSETVSAVSIEHPEGMNFAVQSIPAMDSIHNQITEGLEPLIDSADVVEGVEGTAQFSDNFTDINVSEANELDQSLIDNLFETQQNLNPMNADLTAEEKTQAAAIPASRPVTRPAPVPARSAPVEPESFANIAQEISNFANTDSQLSGMNYDLIITGVDNQETKNLFREAIEDSKFAWDAFEIMKSMKNGQVEIRKMSPAKAYLLAKRLQFLDIEKKWKQNVLS